LEGQGCGWLGIYLGDDDGEASRATQAKDLRGGGYARFRPLFHKVPPHHPVIFFHPTKFHLHFLATAKENQVTDAGY
jgi:hypothetical protein